MRPIDKKFFVTIFIAIISNLALIILCYFLFDSIKTENSQISETKKQIAEYQERMDNIQKILPEIKDLEKAHSGMESLILDKTSLVNFIEEIEYLAKKTGIVLIMKGISFANIEKNKPVFKFTTSGSFADTYHFLYLVENGTYRVGLNRVEIIKEQKNNVWNTDFDLELLSFK